MPDGVAVAGEARGPVMVLTEPLSFWGGVDPGTGRIVDRHHPQAGLSITASILVLPAGRGSSSSSSVLAECLRTGTGPAGIVMRQLDPIVATGAHVAAELYGVACPVVVSDIPLVDGTSAAISVTGAITTD
jgi:predicted aconitase with swiveling domain